MCSITFNSISPLGYQCDAIPIGTDTRLQDWTLIDAESLITPFGKMFVYISDRTHETGMLSLQKPAAFTIDASDKTNGLTRIDFVNQIKKIVNNISNNPDIFAMRTWINMESIFLHNIWHKSNGTWEIFVCSYISNLNELEDPEAIEKQRILMENYKLHMANRELSLQNKISTEIPNMVNVNNDDFIGADD